MHREPGKAARGVSRRSFIRQAAASAGPVAAGSAASEADQSRRQNISRETARTSSTTSPPSSTPPTIRVPEELIAGSKAPVSEIQFPMTGAEVFARACKEEGVAALFCCPGNYGVIHAIANIGIPAFSGRHEGAMTDAADAFFRVSGELAVVSRTEGPGFTDMICGIACANAARTPLLVVASNMALFQEDTEAGIQLAYQQPTTDGMKKYGKRLVTPSRVHEYTAYAFRQLRSGVPRPVHLDFPTEVAAARFKDASELTYYFDKATYRSESWPYPSPKQIDAAVQMLRSAARPIIVSSNGVFYRRGWDALKRLAEKAQIPVVESGAMKGQFPDDHPLSANAAPGALASADVIMLVGQHCMPTMGEFAFGPDARYIRIDQSHEDIGRNLPIELGIVSCEKAALEALADAVPRMDHDAWVAEIAAARQKFEAQNDEYYKVGSGYTDAVHPAVIAKELADFLYRGKLPKDQVTVASGGYGVARYTRRWLRGYRPGQIMNGAYQYGAIGPHVGYSVGVAAAVPRALPLHLFQENVRYDKVGEALGAHGEYVTTPGGFRPALERAWQVAVQDGRPSVINCQGKKEFWLRDSHPPGMLGKIEPGCMSYYH